MCFSPEASFAAAGVLGAVGVAALAQKPPRTHLPFTLFPLVFAVHQSIEGLIWLSLGAGREATGGVVFTYLFFANVFWPVYAPLSVFLMERGRLRRGVLVVLLLVGLIVSAALASVLMRHDYSVRAVHHSLRYSAGHDFGNFMIWLYMLATVAPLLISRHRYVAAFGGAVFAGALITGFAYAHAAASVWCFFAAAASLLVFLHARRQARLTR